MKRFLIAAILTSFGVTAQVHAQAQEVDPYYEFTAISASKGVLGHFDVAASQFNGSAIQVIDNSDLLSVNFTDPFSGALIDTIGPAGYGTFFDSSSGMPRVTAGFGYQALGDHAGQYDSFSIITSSQILFYAGGQLNDVSFTTVSGISAVPEPVSWAMMIIGFGIIGAGMRYRRQRQTVLRYVLPRNVRLGGI